MYLATVIAIQFSMTPHILFEMTVLLVFVKNTRILEKSSIMLKVKVDDATKEMTNDSRNIANLQGHEQNHIAAKIEVRWAEIKLMEERINFPRVLSVDEECSRIV